MDRRTFVKLLPTLALSQALWGCGRDRQLTLAIALLGQSIPPQTLSQFRRYLRDADLPVSEDVLAQLRKARLNFSLEPGLGDLFDRLQAWKRQTNQDPDRGLPLPWIGRKLPVADLATLGDYWLGAAIRQQLIQPMELRSLEHWDNLPERWQSWVTRNDQGELDQSGKIWAAPYRWGSTVIVYRADRLRQEGIKPPQDWGDLWRSDLQQRISLLDQPREVIGLVSKKLGYSYNEENLDQVAGLKDALKALHRQVKLYSSDYYLKPLLLEDTWVAVGWSTDVLPLLRQDFTLFSPQNRRFAAVFPQSGTALWNDLWVRPASLGANQAASGAAADPQMLLAQQWIDFCWRPDVAEQLSLLSNGSSPALLNLKPKQPPEALREQPLLWPPEAALEKSEFLKPLPRETLNQYQQVWTDLRRSS